MNARTTNTPTRAFRKGLRELRIKDAKDARRELREVLGDVTDQTLRNYANGKVQNLDVVKAARIEEIFARYGVRDCWGF